MVGKCKHLVIFFSFSCSINIVFFFFIHLNSNDFPSLCTRCSNCCYFPSVGLQVPQSVLLVGHSSQHSV